MTLVSLEENGFGSQRSPSWEDWGAGEEEVCCLRGEQQEASRMFAQHTHLPPGSWEGQVWECPDPARDQPRRREVWG